MRIARLKIANFRGISSATLVFPNHAVLIGDNNSGKTTILEAIDLALGPDRLRHVPPIDEHDFYHGKYTASPYTDGNKAANSIETTDVESEAIGSPEIAVPEALNAEAPKIDIEVTIVELSEEQKGRFGDYVEFWDVSKDAFYDDPKPDGVDVATVTEALRVTFIGRFDPEEDDFDGNTYFTRTLFELEEPTTFSKKDKQLCGFLYLRSLRTGARALSLERGSLLDIILRLKEVRPQMWEETIHDLNSCSVARDPKLGISSVLKSIERALKRYVPKEWGVEPHLKVSDLTREHLREVITAFIATGEGTHAAPFYRQGTGTINMLVLAMLSQIAEDKQNVIFAMEEPETAVPPYAQKRIVHEVRKLSTQTLFTSHSPYVLEEFTLEETVVLARNKDGLLSRSAILLPESVKLKRYRHEFRTRFCEGLLARRVLVAEGPTEASSFPVVCRRLEELSPKTYSSLEALGICTIDAGGDTNIPDMAKLYRGLGKEVYAICDRQTAEQEALIKDQVHVLLMHQEKGFEDLILKNTTEAALKRFIALVDWPPHLQELYPKPLDKAFEALSDLFRWGKGNWCIADFLAQCDLNDIPEWLRNACMTLKNTCDKEELDDCNNRGSDALDAEDVQPEEDRDGTNR